MNTDFLLKLICKAGIAPSPGYTSPFSSWPLSVSSLCSSCSFCIASLITVTNEPDPPQAPLRAGCPCHSWLRAGAGWAMGKAREGSRRAW